MAYMLRVKKEDFLSAKSIGRAPIYVSTNLLILFRYTYPWDIALGPYNAFILAGIT